VQLLSGHEAVALIGAVLASAGFALAAEGAGRPMFVHQRPAVDRLGGRVRRVGLGAIVVGVAIAVAALATR
jgi:hypothetical protein